MPLQIFWNLWVATESFLFASTQGQLEKEESSMLRWNNAVTESLGPSTEEHSTSFVPRLNLKSLHHVHQIETWDCGIACLLMVMTFLKQDHGIEEERMFMFQAVATQSIWSIDLVNLIEIYKTRGIDISYLYCSMTLEVDETHQGLAFYAQAFPLDQIRVKYLLQQAQKEKWHVMEIELTLSHVLEMLRRPNCIAIALIDNAILMSKGHGTQFSGHYIVLSGIRESDGALQIHNPTSVSHFDYISLQLFEQAWMAKGTDRDVIFISKR
jgi:Guanylylate cyclase